MTRRNSKELRWMRVLLLSLILTFCFTPLTAQFFLHVNDDPFAVSLRFHPDSVRARKIKSVTCAYQYKPDGQIIRDQGLREYYQFDQLGRNVFYWRNRVKGSEMKAVEHEAVYRKGKKIKNGWTEYKYTYIYDTVFVYSYYDSLSRLATRRLCDGDYYHTWYYTYNEDGMVNTQIHVRETNLGAGHRDFRLGVQTIISREDFRYEKYSSSKVKRLSLNDEGKVYKETMLILDHEGRVIDSREAFTAGGIRINTTCVYDPAGRQTICTYSSNAGGEMNEETVFVYDSLGRIQSVKRNFNGVLKDEFSYLYEGGAALAYAYINRRHIEQGIDIVKLFLEVYP